jgi:predicted nucleic acid-binding protein
VARTRRRAPAAPQRLILDSGAVIALSRNDQRARAVLTAAREAGVEVTVPSVVVAETVRGSAADAAVNRVLKAVGEVDVADEATGRIAGGLLGAAGSAATIDAVVVATAVQVAGGVILTGDPTDLGPLADGNPEVVIEVL